MESLTSTPALTAGLTRTSIATLTIRCTYVGLEFLCALAITRLYGPLSYGVYAFVTSCVALLAIPGAAGFDRLLLREAAALRAKHRTQEIAGLFRIGSRISLYASLLLAGILALAGILLAKHQPNLGSGLILGSIALPLLSYARLRQSLIQGFGEIVLGQTPETLVQPILVLSVATLMARTSSDISTPLIAYIIAAAAAGVYGAALLRRVLVPTTPRTPYQGRAADELRRAFPFVMVLAMNTALVYADVVIIGALDDPVHAGTYRIASNAAMLVAFPLTAMNMAAAPLIASSFANNREALPFLATNAARKILIASIAIFLILTVFGKWALGLFGHEFVDAYPVLLILSGAYLLNAASGLSGYLLIMTRHERLAAFSFTLAAVLNIAGNLILVPLYGSIGAAVATAGSIVLLSATLVATVASKLRLDPTALAYRLERT